jgi:GTP cyclohydrolase IB
MTEKLTDIQSQHDDRNIAIDQVGVKDISYPITVMDKAGPQQHTVARVNMYVDLPHNFRGTHMSRFIEVLNNYRGGISTSNIRHILADMKDLLNAERAHFDITFPFFMMKEAPVSRAQGKMEYICRILGDSADECYMLEVRVPVLSLCPCSKEISKYGAHNQRSLITVQIRAKEIIWIEDLIILAESSASSEIYSLLKREDEKFVTERSYENPMFVEDMVRTVAGKLSSLHGILGFTVESENMESIHNHSAYAKISRKMG